MEAAAYAPKPKGERARILELEARLSHLVTGGGASTPSVYRVPACSGGEYTSRKGFRTLPFASARSSARS